MIIRNSILKVADNTNAKLVKCIHISNKRKFAKAGEFIIVSVIKRIFTKKLLSRKVYLSLIISTKKNLNRKNGSYVKFNQNRAILLNQGQKTFFASKISGPGLIELKLLKLQKILFLLRRLL